MDPVQLQLGLRGLPLGPLQYFEQVGSTNDEARKWVAAGAPDLALVLADEQTAGRGRQGRRWFTPPGAALAFSLVLRPPAAQPVLNPMHLTALGALAVSTALDRWVGLPAEIKWPNDVLVRRRKIAGVLVEALWQGDQMEAAILGIGLNVSPQAAPPDDQVLYPATSVETAAGRPASRPELLRAVLESLLEWREHLGRAEFMAAWLARLAFRGEWVSLTDAQNGPPLEGLLAGLEPDGALRLLGSDGQTRSFHAGELRLRPVKKDRA
jgi:BirA family transcriptional regulator, biotin operon repressor / biotin---[acetyl-CoA-carboxylase] ligase